MGLGSWAATRFGSSPTTLMAYDELWRLYIAPKLRDQSLNTMARPDLQPMNQVTVDPDARRAQ
jgi:hypothetical protein